MVDLLLERSYPDVMAGDGHGRSTGDIAADRKVVDLLTGRDAVSALCDVVDTGIPRVVRLILEFREDIDIDEALESLGDNVDIFCLLIEHKNVPKLTPLHYTAEHGHTDMVEQLLKRTYPSVLALDGSGRTSRDVAANAKIADLLAAAERRLATERRLAMAGLYWLWGGRSQEILRNIVSFL
eukprot:705111_1